MAKKIFVANSKTPLKDFSYRNKEKNSSFRVENIDAATVASRFEKQDQQRELIFSFIGLGMKLGLLFVLLASFVRLGISSHHRISRQIELFSILQLESEKLAKLNYRFDRLFTIGGNARLMEDQDQWIKPNSFRVIWR